MTRVFNRAALASCIATTALLVSISTVEGRDLDRSGQGAIDPTRAMPAPTKVGRGYGDAALGERPFASTAHRHKRAPRRFGDKVAPRPDCELGLHGCYVRNGDRHGAF